MCSSPSLLPDGNSLMMENAQLRDRLSFIEGMAGVSSDVGADPASASSSSSLSKGTSKGPSAEGRPPASSSSGGGLQERGKSVPLPKTTAAQSPQRNRVSTAGTPPETASPPRTSQPLAQPPVAVYTASNAALIELQELRRENVTLNKRLMAAQSAAAAGSTPVSSPQRRPPPGDGGGQLYCPPST